MVLFSLFWRVFWGKCSISVHTLIHMKKDTMSIYFFILVLVMAYVLTHVKEAVTVTENYSSKLPNDTA